MKEKAFRFLAKFSVFITMWTVMLGAPGAQLAHTNNLFAHWQSTLGTPTAEAAAVNYIRDVLSRVASSTNADHTITFQLPTALTAGQAIILQFNTSTAGQANFSFIAGGSSTRDIDISTSTIASLGANSCADSTWNTAITITSTSATNSEWSVQTTTNSGGIQITLDQPTNGALVPAATCVRIRIGDGAVNASSATYLTNPASTTNTSTQLRFIVTTPSDTGEGGVAIVGDDQLTANATNTPSLTAEFNVNTSECDATTDLTAQGVLSALSFFDLRADGVVNSRNYLCTRLTSNAANGVNLQIQSVAGRMSSTRANPSGSTAELLFPATAQTSGISTTLDNVEYGILGINTTTEAYGYCISDAGVDNSGAGSGLASPASGVINAADGVSGTCTYRAAANNGFITPTAAAPQHFKLLTNALAPVWSSSEPVYRAFTNLILKAAVTVNTPADSNYQDTITIVAFATF